MEEALAIVEKIGYPVLVRPSFVLGDRGLAYLKSQLASGNKVPSQGNIFVSLKDEDKQKAVPLIRQLVNLGYELYATRGTSTMLYKVGIRPATCSASPVAVRTCSTLSTIRKCSGS